MRIVFDYGETIVDETEEIPDVPEYPGIDKPANIAYKVFSLGIIESEKEYIEILYRLSKYSRKECREYLKKRKSSYKLPEERKQVLESLAEDNSLALFTDQIRVWIDELLENFGIEDLFDKVVVSNEIKKEKPYPKGYHLVSKGYDEVIMVSDELNDDLLMADRFGMKTVWLKRNNEPIYFEPDYTIESLVQFKDIVKNIK